jgi:hypothetical protein
VSYPRNSMNFARSSAAADISRRHALLICRAEKAVPGPCLCGNEPSRRGALGIEANQKVRVASRRGQVTTTVSISQFSLRIRSRTGSCLSRCIFRLQTNSRSLPSIRIYSSLPTNPAPLSSLLYSLTSATPGFELFPRQQHDKFLNIS